MAAQKIINIDNPDKYFSLFTTGKKTWFFNFF